MTGALEPGTMFAGYRIESTLGSGSSGTVYLVRHPRLPRQDALKVLSASDANSRARFVREAETVARLDHPNIVAVHDRGIERGWPWIAMRFVDGIDAAELIRRGSSALSVERVVYIVDQVARGVDAAHTAGVLHRDVNPANILIEALPGEPDRVFVTDFGIARTADRTAADTATGAVLGTVAYAAPEQLTGDAIDGRADVYGLGCTLYELLTGTKPFPRSSVAAVMHAHLVDPPPRVTAVLPALPPQIDAVIARALSKDPRQRFPTCGALAAATEAALLGSAPEPASSQAHRRSRLPVVLAGVALVAGLVAGAAMIVLGQADDPAPTAAASTTDVAATTTATSSAAPTSWGSHRFAIGLFPGLLPQTQDAEGYRGIRCSAVDSELEPISVDEPVGADIWLTCLGDGNPVERLTVNCLMVGVGYDVEPFTDMTVEGDETWQRPSGSGRMIWGTINNKGLLLIDFDRPSRSACGIGVVGLDSGRALYEQWWPDAPL
ncbi:serine/threonine protein kinase [Nocardia uniformis]|uniref:non-specific serine/threonine protein kinase n=1 Tax=Nocardia uniformis TaxID=53432 RepID=A0A849BYF7_9NOCA|nr:serine/threonine-protein kinase [Nocardia uniformis]NNH71314.1 serine/threonine protein kinase [Nocardia uniformis]